MSVRRTNLQIVGPGKARGHGPLTINGPNRPICSARSAPNVEPALLSCYLPATPKPCSFISMRLPPRSPLAHTPFSSSIKPAGMARKPSRFPKTSRSCRCRRVRQNSTLKKTSGNTCVRTGYLTKYFKSFDDIVDHCCFAWTTLIDQPWKIMSIARRDWVIAGQSL